MGCLEGSGVPVLYIGRTVPKGYYLSNIFNFNTFHDFVLLIMLSVANTIKHRDKSVCVCVEHWWSDVDSGISCLSKRKPR